MSEKQYPDWWIKQMEDTLGKDNEWLNYIKKHDELPPKEKEQKPLSEIEDLDELDEGEIYTRAANMLDDLSILITESRRRLSIAQIRLQKLEKKE